MNKFVKKLLKKTEGFTLVELIVVIAILGILAGVAVPAYSGYLDKAKEAGDATTLSAIKTAAQASQAKDGAVTSITVGVTMTGDDKGTITKISATVDSNSVDLYDSSKTGDAKWIDADFATFMNNTDPAKLESKACTNRATLTWNSAWDIDS